MKKILLILKRIFTKQREYVYVFELEMMFEDSKRKIQEGLRIDVFNKIALDLSKVGKGIGMVDIWQDTKMFTTLYTIGSKEPKMYQDMIPLMYEIYAFKKIKKKEIFTYPVEECIFKVFGKEIKVLKFKV